MSREVVNSVRDVGREVNGMAGVAAVGWNLRDLDGRSAGPYGGIATTRSSFCSSMLIVGTSLLAAAGPFGPPKGRAPSADAACSSVNHGVALTCDGRPDLHQGAVTGWAADRQTHHLLNAYRVHLEEAHRLAIAQHVSGVGQQALRCVAPRRGWSECCLDARAGGV